jgi:hypothetical protein
MVIGQEIAVFAEEKSRPLGLGRDFLFPLAGPPEKPFPEIVERHLILRPEAPDLVHPLGHDLDDSGADSFGDADKVEVSPKLRGGIRRGGVERRRQRRGFGIENRGPRGLFLGKVDENVARDDDAEEETDYSDPDDLLHFSQPPITKL